MATKGTTAAVLTVALVAAGSALVEGQEHEPEGWATAHCSVDAVRARHWAYVDETTLEGLFALASMERECDAAAAASAEPEPTLLYDRPWTAFCSDAGLRGRHPNADLSLLLSLYQECQGALQAAADAEQELRVCRYSSVSECHPDRGCAARRSAPGPDERWLEVPPLDMELDTAGSVATMGDGPWPTVRRCDTRGCDRIEVDAGRAGGYFVLQQRDGAWFVKIQASFLVGPGPNEGRFVEVATQQLSTLIYYGTCPT